MRRPQAKIAINIPFDVFVVVKNTTLTFLSLIIFPFSDTI